MNSLELIVKEQKTLNKFLLRQRTSIAGISATQDKFIDEELMPKISLVAEELTLDLAFEPVSESTVSYKINKLTGEVVLHPQQVSEELESVLTNSKNTEPTLGLALRVVNRLALSIQDKELGLNQNEYDESEIYEQTVMMMQLMGEIFKV